MAYDLNTHLKHYVIWVDEAKNVEAKTKFRAGLEVAALKKLKNGLGYTRALVCELKVADIQSSKQFILTLQNYSIRIIKYKRFLFFMKFVIYQK